MNTFRDKLKQSGYDAEEAYFHKREQDLIKKMRDETAKAKTHLTLIKGGLEDKPPQLPAGRVNRKAA